MKVKTLKLTQRYPLTEHCKEYGTKHWYYYIHRRTGHPSLSHLKR